VRFQRASFLGGGRLTSFATTAPNSLLYGLVFGDGGIKLALFLKRAGEEEAGIILAA
jgi:hypothetical protein